MNFPSVRIPSMVGRPMLRASSKIGDIDVKVCVFTAAV